VKLAKLTDCIFCTSDGSQGSVYTSRESAVAVIVRRADSDKSHIQLLDTTLKQQRHFTQKYRNKVTAAGIDSLAAVVTNKHRI